MIIQSLNENWSIEISGKPGSYPVQVPGSVYSALLEAGQMEDPYYRDNEGKALEPVLHPRGRRVGLPSSDSAL